MILLISHLFLFEKLILKEDQNKPEYFIKTQKKLEYFRETKNKLENSISNELYDVSLFYNISSFSQILIFLD